MKKGIDYIGVGVGAAIFDEVGNILLKKRGNGARNEKGMWEIPGGSVEFGETFEQAVKREMKEELGIEIIIHESLNVGDHIVLSDHQHWVYQTFVATIKKGQPKNLEPQKCDEIRWFSLREMKNLSLSIVTKLDYAVLKLRCLKGFSIKKGTPTSALF